MVAGRSFTVFEFNFQAISGQRYLFPFTEKLQGCGWQYGGSR